MNNEQQQQFQQNMHMGSGLTRYRSAPSSYFASLLDTPSTDGAGFGEDDFEQLFNPRASSPETQRIFSRFMNSSDTVQQNCSSNLATLPSQPQLNSQFLPPAKNEPDLQQQLQRQQSNEYSSASQMVYQTSNSEDNSYNKLWGSFNSNRRPQMKMEAAVASGSGGDNPGLIRHSSSPAGLFANINIENEFNIMRGIKSVGGRNSANAEASFSTSGGKFKSQMDDRQFGDNRANDASYIPGSWDDPPILSDNFLNELADNDNTRFSNTNASDDQSNDGGNQPRTLLSHHLSLPKSSAELSAVEKLLQDSVPCKIRAKRGCATHPRSIAERVRRTKISERMRKLQELVPNMEKQTNTSDMLDLAVDYIKDLQKQVKTLADNREKCTCSAKQQS